MANNSEWVNAPLDIEVAAADMYLYLHMLHNLPVHYSYSIDAIRQEAQRRIDELVVGLAPVLRDYYTLAVFGELRNISRIGHALEITQRHSSAVCYMHSANARSKAYSRATHLSRENILSIAEQGFQYRWFGGYGGKRWLSITRHLAQYTSKQWWVDVAFSLEHNYGNALNKDAAWHQLGFPSVMTNRLRDVLNTAADVQPTCDSIAYYATDEAVRLCEAANARYKLQSQPLYHFSIGRQHWTVYRPLAFSGTERAAIRDMKELPYRLYDCNHTVWYNHEVEAPQHAPQEQPYTLDAAQFVAGVAPMLTNEGVNRAV